MLKNSIQPQSFSIIFIIEVVPRFILQDDSLIFYNRISINNLFLLKNCKENCETKILIKRKIVVIFLRNKQVSQVH